MRGLRAAGVTGRSDKLHRVVANGQAGKFIKTIAVCLSAGPSACGPCLCQVDRHTAKALFAGILDAIMVGVIPNIVADVRWIGFRAVESCVNGDIGNTRLQRNGYPARRYIRIAIETVRQRTSSMVGWTGRQASGWTGKEFDHITPRRQSSKRIETGTIGLGRLDHVGASAVVHINRDPCNAPFFWLLDAVMVSVIPDIIANAASLDNRIRIRGGVIPRRRIGGSSRHTDRD